MDDASTLTRERTAFTGALLVILLALIPAYPFLDDLRIPVFGDEFRMSYAYLIVASLLGSALYCYALSVVSVKRDDQFRRFGDVLYAFALFSVPATILTYLIGYVQFLLFPNQEIANVVARTFAGIIVIVMLWKIKPFVAAVERLEAAHRKVVSATQAQTLITRAMELHQLGYYEPAVMQAANALIAAAKGMMPYEKRRNAQIIDVYRWILAEKSEVVEDLRGQLDTIRTLRNKAAHGVLEIDDRSALDVVRMCARLVNVLTVAKEKAPNDSSDPL